MATSTSQLDFLTPGSVWQRLTDARIAKFLMLTNTSLKAKTQLKHPPQVVYADADGNMFNRDVDNFLETYKFFNVDASLESKLNALVVFNEDDYEGDEDDGEEGDTEDDSDEPVELLSGSHAPTLADQLADELADTSGYANHSANASHADSLEVGFAFEAEEGLTLSPLTAQQLTDSLAMYSQEPNKEFSATQHRLTFALSDDVTIDALKAAFMPSENASTVEAFQVRTKFGHETVYWTGYVGVYPDFGRAGLYASVLVTTEDNPFKSNDAPEADEEELEADADVAPAEQLDGPLEVFQKVNAEMAAEQVVMQPFSQVLPVEPQPEAVVTSTPPPAVTPIVQPVVAAAAPRPVVSTITATQKPAQ